MSAPAAAAAAPSALAPLRHRAFAVLWLATVVSNVGTWMNEVGAGWLMTSLAPSALMVSLVQAATAAPVFLLALPAGALADILDRRKLLLAVQAFMALVAALMAFVALAGAMTPLLLLTFTFLLGAGTAFVAPAWQAIVPKLVPREALQPAIALNSVGINISRAIGPALGGAVIVAFGAAAPFVLNAASFLCVIAALFWWRPAKAQTPPLPAERLGGAIRAGLRYAAASPPLLATLVRAVAFFLFASAYWALLPLIARQTLAGGPGLYGLLVGAIGAGAVAGALFLPGLKRRLGPDRTVAAGTLATATALVVFALVQVPVLAVGASALAGMAWIAVLSNLNVSAQVALPDWVRARGLAVFITVFFGTMTLGSVVWGQVAGILGIPAALLLSAAGAILAIAATWPAKLQQGLQLDLAPALHWPAPVVADGMETGEGPVMVAVEYRVDGADRNAFLAALNRLAAERRRDGAHGWSVWEDAAEPGRFVETFMEPSWSEHLRHHARVTVADRALQDAVRAFHTGPEPPRVTHLLSRG